MPAHRPFVRAGTSGNFAAEFIADGGNRMLCNSSELIWKLRRKGFELVESRGPFHKFVDPAGRRVAIVPHPRRRLPVAVVQVIEALEPSAVRGAAR